MRITIDERESAQDIEVGIVCKKVDRRVLDIVARLRMLDWKITGFHEGSTHIVNAEDVLYVESVDKRTFFYTIDSAYETPLRLYEIEQQLGDCNFLRVAKGCLVNFGKISSLRPDINGRIIATMEGGDRIAISRQYAPEVKRKLGIIQ